MGWGEGACRLGKGLCFERGCHGLEEGLGGALENPGLRGVSWCVGRGFEGG